MNEKARPDCYECQYRGTIPGDTHSRCLHPKVKSNDNSFGAMMDTLDGKNNDAIKELNIKGHPQGIRGGWFLWPSNFDPTWLVECSVFKPKESALCIVKEMKSI